MRIPGFTATASLGPSSIVYKGEVDPGGRSQGTIVPAATCDYVNCDWAQASCFGSLDLDPFTCGLYYGCCYGKPSEPVAGTSDCRSRPCDPGCPWEGCIPSMQSALSSSDLSSQIATLSGDLKRQLNRIQRCACGPPPVVRYVPPPVYVPPVPPPVYVPPLVFRR